MWPVMPYLSSGASQADAIFASRLQHGDEPSAGQVRQAVAAARRSGWRTRRRCWAKRRPGCCLHGRTAGRVRVHGRTARRVHVHGDAGQGVNVDGHAGRLTARRFAYQTDMACVAFMVWEAT